MIAHVIPLRRMPLSLPYLDYIVPDELLKQILPGHLVSIPFRHSEHFGVVRGVQKQARSNHAPKLREITKIIGERPALDRSQLGFLFDIATLYHTSFGFLLKTNLLPLQKRKLSKVTFSDRSAANRDNKIVTPSIFTYDNEEEKREYIKKLIDKESQTLILVPELPDIGRMINLLKLIPDSVSCISSEITDKKLFTEWLQINQGVKEAVIGTRRAIFLPWNNLKNIIVDDEGNPSHKSWDMAPRCNAKDAAMLLAKRHQSHLHLLAHTPSVESFYYAVKRNYPSNDNTKKIKSFDKPQAEIIDMRQERKAGNYGFMSAVLTEAVKNTSAKGDIFLFLNRRGSASHVGCRDCGQVMKCPRCQHTLTFHQDSSSLKCHYCGYEQKMVTVCPVCHGVTMAMYGVGTQLAESTVRRMIGSASGIEVLRVDSDAGKRRLTADDGGKNKTKKIIIGTEMAWPYLNWTNISLMGMIDVDTFLFVPEFKVTEKMWMQLRDALYRLSPSARLLIQTSHPGHGVFKALYEPLPFYVKELRERAALEYPPYWFILRLLYAASSKSEAEAEAGRLYSAFLPLTKENGNIKIKNPAETMPPIQAGKYWQMILVKIRQGEYERVAPKLLSVVPGNWKVDPNPNTILSI